MVDTATLQRKYDVQWNTHQNENNWKLGRHEIEKLNTCKAARYTWRAAAVPVALYRSTVQNEFVHQEVGNKAQT
jgi:hypothetical protein